MAEHHNEIRGGHFTGPVVQSGNVGNLNIHVGGEAAPHPPLTSWADRPELTPPLRDVLTAQLSATESLPYQLLGVKQPDLTEVYVRQTMRAQQAEQPERRTGDLERRTGELDRRATGEPAERTVTMTEALNRGGHLLITGEPGAGKSTAGYMYVQQISEYWLADQGAPPVAEPVLPVRVPARALAENATWGELLATGLQSALGQLLDGKPRPELLARRALGARWLVFVDGLDEIVEPQARSRVITALAHRIRRSRDHRLVIATRPLSRAELSPLEQAGVDSFEILPFSPVELEEFARAWFRAQDPLTMATTRAAEFVRQVRDSRLRELVRNPLQATITAIAHTLEPDRQLPNNRIDLYDRFMTYLLDEKASRRDTFAELRRGVGDDAARLALLDWLRQHRTELVEQLAVHRLETESPLTGAARAWVTERRTDLPEGWEGDLHAVLAGTGVFVPADGDLRFRHHSFAEFLAARSRAGEIPADFPDLEEWIERGLTGAKHVFALFTFVLWGRADNDIGYVLRLLLEGTGDRVLLAGNLLSEGVETGEQLAATVVDRILDLMVCRGARTDPWDDLETIGEVLSSFTPALLGYAAIERLRGLRDNADIAEATRIEAAAVLGHLGEEGAIGRLEDFLPHAGLAGVRRGAGVLRDLSPDGPERVENLLIRIAAANEDDRVLTIALISLLLDVDRPSAAAKMVREQVKALRGTQDFHSYTDSDSRLADLPADSPANWGEFAELAARANCREEALWAARRAFDSPGTPAEEFRAAVDAVLSAGGSDGAAEVVAACAERPAGHLLEAAQVLRRKSHPSAALELAGRVLTNPNIKEIDVFQVAWIFTSCDATTELLDRTNELPAWRNIQLISALPGDVKNPQLEKIARAAITDHSIDRWEFSRAARTLLHPDDPAMAQQVYETSLLRGPDFWAVAAAALCASGHGALGTELITKVHRDAEVDTWVDLTDELVQRKQVDRATDLLTAAVAHLSQCSGYRQSRLVDALAKAGRRSEALAAAGRVVAENTDGSWLDRCVELWIEIGGVAGAEDILNTMLTRDTPAEHRMKVADEFAKAGLLAPAVKVWLHGPPLPR